MLKVDARGDACPLPVVKAKKAIAELNGIGEVEVLVDNEIAVQNLTKMAQQKGYASKAEKLAEREYRVLFTVGDAPAEAASRADRRGTRRKLAAGLRGLKAAVRGDSSFYAHVYRGAMIVIIAAVP